MRVHFVAFVLVLTITLAGCQSTGTDPENRPANSENQPVGKQRKKQQKQSGKPASIALTGIVDLGWGADTRAVRDRYGAPDETDHPDGKSTVTSYVYTGRTLAGYSARKTLYFGRKHGLILAAYKVPFESDADCQAMFRKISGIIAEANPSVEPSTYREHESGKPFCQAVREGKARWEKGWLLPESPSLAVITIDPGASHIDVAMIAPAFEHYMQRPGGHG